VNSNKPKTFANHQSLKIMKRIFLLLFAVSLAGCEKDDICDETTSTTPQVVIEFYNAASPNTLRNVSNLKIVADGFTTALSGTTGVSKIKVPLQINAETTTWQFIENGLDTDATNDNTDVLTFNYGHTDVFVSRACGYKTIFNLTNSNTNLVTTDADNWIDNITIIQPNIETENETHIKIYF
jgi:Family of unknown function (DUF6452)